MPTANAKGDIILEVPKSDPDRRLAEKLQKLRYPEDLVIITHLSYTYFQTWLYGQEPRRALFLTNERKFRMIQASLREQTQIQRLFNYLWRRWHGLDY